MQTKNTFIPGELRELTPEELLVHYDNPRNFEVHDCREQGWENSNKDFPEHCLVFLTHGTFYVNSKIRRTTQHTIKDFNRLIKNYSDFGTRKAIKKSGIPEDNIITSPGSRGISDYNRENKSQTEDNSLPDGQKSIRPYDFNEIVIIDNPGQFREEGQYKTNIYHGALEYALNYVEESSGGSIGFDIHDTGVNLMGVTTNDDQFREGGFPLITLGTKDGESCNQEILDYFAERLNYYLGIQTEINTPFKGGYVTNRHGLENRKEKSCTSNPADKSIRNMIQIELGRFLYMKESTQEVDWERMEIIGEGLKRAIADTGIKFGNKYFENLKK